MLEAEQEALEGYREAAKVWREVAELRGQALTQLRERVALAREMLDRAYDDDIYVVGARRVLRGR